MWSLVSEKTENLTLSGIICSSTFILQVVWFLALSFVINFYIGTYYFWVKHLTDTRGLDFEGLTASL